VELRRCRMTDSEKNDEPVDGDCISFWTNNRGYSQASSEGDMVGIHVLLATLSVPDVDRVFSDETEVHHVSGNLLDIPANVEVVTRSEHRELHNSDTPLPSPDELLSPADPESTSAETTDEVSPRAD